MMSTKLFKWLPIKYHISSAGKKYCLRKICAKNDGAHRKSGAAAVVVVEMLSFCFCSKHFECIFYGRYALMKAANFLFFAVVVTFFVLFFSACVNPICPKNLLYSSLLVATLFMHALSGKFVFFGNLVASCQSLFPVKFFASHLFISLEFHWA